MEGGRIFKKDLISVAHLPTLMLAIGYPLYWAQLLGGTARDGVTSPAAWMIYIFLVVFVLWREREAIVQFTKQSFDAWRKEQPFVKWGLACGCFISCVILACAFLASMYPPHLMQESDTMNYHLSMPRQHLITASFKHVPWSADDFFFLPLDFALAPFWFATTLPNKIPQFLFLLSLIMIVASLIQTLKGKAYIAFVIGAFALLGSHGHGIQMGTAMLDLLLCYLFLASLDSFLKKQKWLFIIEFSFFLWAKSLVFLQIFVWAGILAGVFFLLARLGFSRAVLDFDRAVSSDQRHGYGQFLGLVIPWILFLSIFIAGPFMAKSVYYTGTPFFPVGFGNFSYHPGIPEGSRAWDSLARSAEFLNSSIHRDGYGRTVVHFFTHFWDLAVPEDQVNNAFDYPMGLTYLIFLGPFIVLFVRSLLRKEIAFLPWMVVVYWMLWWLSVRETRHLYVPVLLMAIVTITALKEWSKVFLSVLVLALMLNAVSIYRAHKSYLGKPAEDILRADDKVLVDLSRKYLKEERTGAVELEEHEVAFAQFPVVVRTEFLPHVIEF